MMGFAKCIVGLRLPSTRTSLVNVELLDAISSVVVAVRHIPRTVARCMLPIVSMYIKWHRPPTASCIARR